MNVRDAMLQIIRGQTPAGLLFVPRMDIWYNRNKVRRTLPEGLDDRSLPEILAALYDGIIDSVARSSADVVLFGANYDDAVTSPPFFDEHITSWLNRAADHLHGAGKYLLTHTDGENKGLMPLFEKCRFDIADSICPAPMTKVSFQEYRDAFGKRITIWGGIPSVVMLKDCCPEEEFRQFVRTVIRDAKPYNNLILSVADTMPPDADFGRIRHLVDVCRKTFD